MQFTTRRRFNAIIVMSSEWTWNTVCIINQEFWASKRRQLRYQRTLIGRRRRNNRWATRFIFPLINLDDKNYVWKRNVLLLFIKRSFEWSVFVDVGNSALLEWLKSIALTCIGSPNHPIPTRPIFMLRVLTQESKKYEIQRWKLKQKVEYETVCERTGVESEKPRR